MSGGSAVSLQGPSSPGQNVTNIRGIHVLSEFKFDGPDATVLEELFGTVFAGCHSNAAKEAISAIYMKHKNSLARYVELKGDVEVLTKKLDKMGNLVVSSKEALLKELKKQFKKVEGELAGQDPDESKDTTYLEKSFASFDLRRI